MVEVAAGEEVVVVQALEEMAGLPAVPFSRLPVLRHHVGVMGSDSGSVGSLCHIVNCFVYFRAIIVAK